MSEPEPETISSASRHRTPPTTGDDGVDAVLRTITPADSDGADGGESTDADSRPERGLSERIAALTTAHRGLQERLNNPSDPRSDGSQRAD